VGGGVTVEVCSLCHRYRSPAGTLSVLEALALWVPAGGHLAVTGPSGSGKSTLLAVLGGLEPPQSGSVKVGGTDLFGLHGGDLAAYRRSTVGFVFQHFGLLDTLTALENVELAASLGGGRARRRRQRARELLAAVGLQDRAGHRPTQLSGGERQRVALARAMVGEPRLLLADEPTGNLDEESAATVVDLIESLHRDAGCTLVVVTHDRRLAARAPLQLGLRAPGAAAA
jgi:putative ABC transport system ATP-binding protein